MASVLLGTCHHRLLRKVVGNTHPAYAMLLSRQVVQVALVAPWIIGSNKALEPSSFASTTWLLPGAHRRIGK